MTSGRRMTIAKKIRERRKELGMTQLQLAECLGVGNTSISDWENSRSSPDPDRLPALARALKVDIAFFDVAPDPAPRSEVLKAIGELKSMIRDRTGTAGAPPQRTIPVWANVAAGVASQSNQVPDHCEPLGRFAVGDDVLAIDSDAYAVVVKGESMHPEVQEEDIILVSPNSDIKTGDIVIAVTNDGEFVKRFQRRAGAGGSEGELVSVNQDYPPIRLRDNRDVKIVKVLALYRDYASIWKIV